MTCLIFQIYYNMCTSYILPTSSVCTGQMGCFLVRSTTGNTNIIVLYDYDSSYIHVETIPSRNGYQMVLVQQLTYTLLTSIGLRSSLQHLDNEASHALIHYLEDENVDFQLVPHFIYRMNAAERATHTFKTTPLSSCVPPHIDCTTSDDT